MEIPSNLYIYIDLFIALIFVVFIIIGYKKGFLLSLLSLFYSFLAVIASWFLSPVFAKMYPLVKLENLDEKAQILAKLVDINNILNNAIYFVLIFLVLKLFYFVLGLILKKMNKIPVIGKFNQILGAICGILNAIIVTIVLSLLFTLPIIKNGKSVINGTVFKYVNKCSEKIIGVAIDNIDFEQLKSQIQGIDIEQARESVKDWLNLNNGK